MQKAYRLAVPGAVAVLMLAGVATAQQPTAQQHLTQQRLAQQHLAQQAAPAQDELPQSTTASYGNWVLQCQTRAGAPSEKTCEMVQVAQTQNNNAPFSRLAIARPVKGQAVKLVLQVPVNASFASNVRIQAGDTDPGIAAPFARCIPGGCFAEFDLRDDMLRKFRTGSGNGKFTFADAGGHDVSVPISFSGFAQAFDALERD
jgi:invasion protein IalB